ncbi:hypothetical protein BsWGS_04229 [Bradybaena similaris]
MAADSTRTDEKDRLSFSSMDTESLKRLRPWRNKGHKRLYRMVLICLAYALAVLLINGYRAVNTGAGNGETGAGVSVESDSDLALQRYERSVQGFLGLSEEEENKTCTPRSVNNFPGNFMNFSDTKNGGFVIHLLISIYMFAALAVVCDDYFVPALEHICEDLGLQPDVAGATFMAAGSSAPEFMTSVIGVFFAESDVGVGTIVGSAVFNILFIIGVCGLFAGMIVDLTWYPLVRDTIFYLVSVLALFLTIRNQRVEWYEAMIMIILYILYIVIMYFNRPIEKKARALLKRMKTKLGHQQPLVARECDEPVISESMQRARAHSRISYTLSLSKSLEYSKSHQDLDRTLPEEQETPILENSKSISLETPKNEQLMTVSEFESVWKVPDNFFVRCIWVAMCPLRALLYISVPDSRRPGIWARLYMLSFVMSVLWISGLTYIMVWMVTIAGDALDVPDTVMGLTLLAAGTSVPDCLSSVFVARDGYGDMAVSNTLGSNVFDILMCLGLPWLLECIISNGDSVKIESGGLTYSTLILLATVLFLVTSMAVNKWRLTRPYGGLCLVVYVIIITLTCLFELNVFDDINAPSCARE